MRDSDLSLDSHDVFHYDLLDNAPNDNDKDLLVHLEALRKEASKDGDVVFVLPNNARIWVHSPLFYIAAGKKLPTEFGTPRHLGPGPDIIEKVRNDSGTDVTVLYVSEEDQSAFEKVMDACYKANSLDGIWEAMGYGAINLNRKELDTSAPLNPTLPTSLLPDFEIKLKEPGDGPSFCVLKVHKFLLARRIPYYETFFNSKFADASGNTSTVNTEDFTTFSLWIVAGFVYQQKLSTILMSHQKLADYIARHPATPGKTLCCATFGADRPIPDVGIVDKLLEIARAAHYLQVTGLENWAHFFLCELGHHFQCSGRGSSILVPHILNLVADSEITDRWILKKGISLLAQHRNIAAMWKRPLLNCTPSVLESLIAEIKTNSEGGVEKGGRGVQLFVELSNLRRHTLSSKNSDDWDKKLLVPLMDHTVEVIARRFDSSDTTTALSNLFGGLNFSRPIAEELLGRIVCSNTLGERNCRQIFVGTIALVKSCGSNAPEVNKARTECISWFQRKWVTLTFSPSLKAPKGPSPRVGEPRSRDIRDREDQRNSTETSTPLSTHWRGPPLTSRGTDKLKGPLAENGGNFFSTWNEEDLRELAKVLPASVSDLVATSHRKGPPIDDSYRPLKETRRGNYNSGNGVRGGAGGRRGAL